MRCKITYQVFTMDARYRSRIWRYETEAEAEVQYRLCLCNKQNKVIELQMAVALKEAT